MSHVRESRKLDEVYNSLYVEFMIGGELGKKAAPRIVVFCEPAHEHMVKQCVKTEAITDLCKSTEAGVPTFAVTVTCQSP